jgi:hypothetical protein
LALSVELSSYPFIERTQKMNVTIDMDQELSKRVVAQTRNGQGYLFSLKRLKRPIGTERLTSMTVYGILGESQEFFLPYDQVKLYHHTSTWRGFIRLGGVSLTYHSDDLKDRVVHVHPPLGQHVMLSVGWDSSNLYLHFMWGNDSDPDPLSDLMEEIGVDHSGLVEHQLSLFPS